MAVAATVVPASANLTVEIISPTVDPYVTLPDSETSFAAAAYWCGDPVAESDVSWSWSFGDTGSATGNPAAHIYTSEGNYACTVTALYQQEQAQDNVAMADP